jgi:hypothetical protein
MAKARRYSIEVKDAKTNALVLSTAVDWTNDEKQLALGQMFRLPGIVDPNSLASRVSQRKPTAPMDGVSPKRMQGGDTHR